MAAPGRGLTLSVSAHDEAAATSFRLTAFLAAIAALTSLCIDMSLPTVPAIEHEFGLLAGRGSFTMSLFLAGYALTPLLGGPLADRFGRKPVLRLALLGFSAAALVCGAAPNFATLLCFRLVQGCAAGVATTLPLAILRDLLSGPAARRRVSEIAVVNNLMPIVAPILGSLILRLGSWRLIFGTQASFGASILLLSLASFKETLAVERRQPLNARSLCRTYRHLLLQPTFRRFALVNGLSFACIFSFISVSPLLLMQQMGVRHQLYPVLFALMATGSIGGSALSVVLTRRHLGGHRLILAGLLCLIVMSALAAGLQLWGCRQPASLLIPMFFALLGFGLLVPAVNVGAMEPVPEYAGAGSGALRGILMVSGSGASALLTALCARRPAQAGVLTTVTMLLLATAAAVLYLRRPERADSGSPVDTPG